MVELAGLNPEAKTELLEAALDTLDEGIAVLDAELRIIFWNQAAAGICGFQSADLLSRPCPVGLYQIDPQHPLDARAGIGALGALDRAVLVHLRHRQGHTLPAMLRRVALRDAVGKRFGTLLRFHPAEEVDALCHGESDEGVGVEHSQAELDDRLDAAFQDWNQGEVPFGLLWITVDQAATLRKTHGRDACEAMLEIVQRTLLHGLRPTEILGRWGDNEFLVLSHERSAEMLTAHGQRLAGLARTAEFRWWGDRVSLTMSIGAAQAQESVTLHDLVSRAREGMQISIYAGGNHVTNLTHEQSHESGGRECSQS